MEEAQKGVELNVDVCLGKGAGGDGITKAQRRTWWIEVVSLRQKR